MNDHYEQRLEHLEENLDCLRMQNRMLTVALKAVLRTLPQDFAPDIVEAVQTAFEDEALELGYNNNHDGELFQDVAYEFFSERH